MRPAHGNTSFGPITTLTAVLVVAACSGQIGATDPGSGGGGGGTGASGGSTPNLDCSSPRAAALHARLLTPTQYNNSLQDLVKVGGNPSRDFSGAVDGALDELSVERYSAFERVIV